MDETMKLLTRLAACGAENTYLGTVTVAITEEGAWRVGIGSPRTWLPDEYEGTKIPLKVGATFREAALKALADQRNVQCVIGQEEAVFSGVFGLDEVPVT